MKTRYSIAAVGCALVLSACGGGGGGSGGGAGGVGSGGGTTNSTPVQTAGLSTIAAADAPRAASNSYGAGSLADGWSSPMIDLMAGVSVTPPDASVVSTVLDLVRHAYDSNGANLLTGATVSNACVDGGTMTLSETLFHTHTTISNGDRLTLTANNCASNGSTTNGTLSITVSGSSGNVFYNSGPGTLTLDATFSNFQTTSGSNGHFVNGDMKLGIASTNDTDATFTVSGQSLQVTELRSGATVATLGLTGYSIITDMRGKTGTTTADFSVSGNANGTGQFAYTVKNLQPFVRTTGSAATSGSLIVYGGVATVTATVVSGGVRVDYSAKGDGVVTQSSTLSWNDFSAGF